MKGALATVLGCWLTGCGLESGDGPARHEAVALTGGDPTRGRALVHEYGCDACHTIPGVAGADREVGPPLTGLANRVYIAGVLPNVPENLIAWIQDPDEAAPKTAMPDVGVTQADARHIAAYLYSIE